MGFELLMSAFCHLPLNFYHFGENLRQCGCSSMSSALNTFIQIQGKFHLNPAWLYFLQLTSALHENCSTYSNFEILTQSLQTGTPLCTNDNTDMETSLNMLEFYEIDCSVVLGKSNSLNSNLVFVELSLSNALDLLLPLCLSWD